MVQGTPTINDSDSQERLEQVLRQRPEQEFVIFNRIKANAQIARLITDEVHPERPCPDYCYVWRTGAMVLPEIFPRLFRLLRGTLRRMGCNRAIILFLFNNASVRGAGALHSPDPVSKPGRLPDLIIMSKELRTLLTHAELRFLFGHEAAHHVHNHCPVYKVFRRLKEQGYPQLTRETVRDIERWLYLIECAADRAGLLAVRGCVKIAASALIKLATGLRPEQEQTNLDEALAGIANLPPGLAPFFVRVRWLQAFAAAGGVNASAEALRAVNEEVYKDVCRLVP